MVFKSLAEIDSIARNRRVPVFSRPLAPDKFRHHAGSTATPGCIELGSQFPEAIDPARRPKLRKSRREILHPDELV